MSLKKQLDKTFSSKPEEKKPEIKHPYQYFLKMIEGKDKYITSLPQHEEWYKAIRAAMETVSATPTDMFVHGITYRAEAINKGYLTLTKSGNYLCAIALIRMQLDNAVMAYAGLLAKNQDQFFLAYNSGKPINQLKDAEGNSLTQGFIVRKFAEENASIKEVFDEGSEYIHASRVAQDASIDLTSGIQLMNYENYKTPDSVRFKAHHQMRLANNLLISVLSKWVKLKHNDL